MVDCPHLGPGNVLADQRGDELGDEGAPLREHVGPRGPGGPGGPGPRGPEEAVQSPLGVVEGGRRPQGPHIAVTVAEPVVPGQPAEAVPPRRGVGRGALEGQGGN